MSEVLKNYDTKEKILKVAGELFAEQGFTATSVRQLASKAQVNLSAVNYHFKTKETLYWEVFNYQSIKIEEGIERLGEKSTEGIKEFSLKVFDFFIKNNHFLMNTFKIFLTSGITIPDEGIHFHCEQQVGPPGRDIFYKKIIDELGEKKVSEEKIDWAVSMIFSIVIHYGVISETTFMKKKAKMDPNLEVSSLRNSIGLMVDAIMLSLRQL